jgi:hypothetical protein
MVIGAVVVVVVVGAVVPLADLLVLHMFSRSCWLGSKLGFEHGQ